MLSKEGNIFVAEQAVIKQMAAAGSAVFVGHCAAEALKDNQKVLRVFVRSSEEEKKKRITQKYGIAENKAESTMRKFNRKRANYYYVNTSRKWENPDNYDIILNSGVIGVDGNKEKYQRNAGMDEVASLLGVGELPEGAQAFSLSAWGFFRRYISQNTLHHSGGSLACPCFRLIALTFLLVSMV